MSIFFRIINPAISSELFSLIDQNLKDTRLHTIGIGSAPNSYFMTEAAKVGRGTYRYIGNINEVNKQMFSLFTQINKPLMQNIMINWPSKKIEEYPHLIPDLYAGKPLVVSTRWLKTNINKDKPFIEISGTLASTRWEETIDVSDYISLSKTNNTSNKLPPLNHQSKGVSQWWASQKLSDLLLQKRRISEGEGDILKRQITNLALKHHLLSPYTSFIAIEERTSRSNEDTLRSEAIKNLMPKGSTQIIPMPNTSLGIVGYFYLGLFCIMLALLFHCSSRALIALPSNR